MGTLFMFGATQLFFTLVKRLNQLVDFLDECGGRFGRCDWAQRLQEVQEGF
jgi:hypothetical protein